MLVSQPRIFAWMVCGSRVAVGVVVALDVDDAVDASMVAVPGVVVSTKPGVGDVEGTGDEIKGVAVWIEGVRVGNCVGWT